ncbi:hypothetical protein WR25_02512 [Diploscapter pachys]|uniref:Uncharacterized protein n=1 Tax=Diploscapter pachys TaxID=2018661 RepID=A0A2A2M5P9_9BILA|nr:hypothetical protein WR25_02512 [Diploscapter pachys]
MPRACSAVADLVMRKAVRALNSCDPAIPARITWALSWRLPLARDSSSTRANAASAPMKAPADSDSTAPPRPNSPTATAPVEAPADRPSRYGSANGLRSSAWRITPQVASPAPQAAATRVRGRR